MSSALESALLLAHGGMSVLSLTLSLLQVIIVFRHTPATFSTYAVMLKCHALIDLYVAVGSSMSMQRFLPIDWSLFVLSDGICTHISSSACVLSCVIFLGGESCFFHSIAASFVFRLLVIRRKTPTARQALALFCVTSLPSPIIFSVAAMTGVSDDATMRHLLVELRPDYTAGAVTALFLITLNIFSGFIDIRCPFVYIILFILVVLGWPLFTIIVYLRSQILADLNHDSSSFSEKSKVMQRKLVRMLTVQAAIPLLQLYFVVIFFLGYLDIGRNTALEISGPLVGGSISFLSPIVVLYSIDQYKRAVLNLFRRSSDKSTTIQTSVTSVAQYDRKDLKDIKF